MKRDKMPLVSVVVTTYNRKELLKETVNSILEQTFTDFELIVVDNYSSYDFKEYMSSFNDKRIRVFQNQNNGIIAVNRNFGIEKAKGNYIAFCDDDDLWHKNKLEIQLKVLTDNEDLIGVGSSLILFGETKMRRNKKYKKDIRINYSAAFLFNTCPLSSLMVRKNEILFDTYVEFKAAEDFDFQLQHLLATGKEMLLLKESLVYYRVHLENISSNSKNLLNALNVLRKHKNNIDKPLYKQAQALVYLVAGFKLLRAQTCLETSRGYIKKAFYLSKNNRDLRFKTVLLLIMSYFPFYLKLLFKGYYRLT
jgi:glycosyltransferase involved in cell wall biosynthesis